MEDYNSHQPSGPELQLPSAPKPGAPLASYSASGTYGVFLNRSPACQAKEGSCYMEALCLAVHWVEVPLRPDMQSPRGDPSLRVAVEKAVGKGFLSDGDTGTLLNVASWSQGNRYREQLGKLEGVGVSFACWLRACESGDPVIAGLFF